MAKRPTRRVPIHLSLAFVECRTWGHAWEDFIPNGKRPTGWGSKFSLRCARCAAERHDTIDSLGRVGTRHYVYPDGYSLAADETPTREQLRLDLLNRLRNTARTRVARQTRKAS